MYVKRYIIHNIYKVRCVCLETSLFGELYYLISNTTTTEQTTSHSSHQPGFNSPTDLSLLPSSEEKILRSEIEPDKNLKQSVTIGF